MWCRRGGGGLHLYSSNACAGRWQSATPSYRGARRGGAPREAPSWRLGRPRLTSSHAVHDPGRRQELERALGAEDPRRRRSRTPGSREQVDAAAKSWCRWRRRRGEHGEAARDRAARERARYRRLRPRRRVRVHARSRTSRRRRGACPAARPHTALRGVIKNALEASLGDGEVRVRVAAEQGTAARGRGSRIGMTPESLARAGEAVLHHQERRGHARMGSASFSRAWCSSDWGELALDSAAGRGTRSRCAPGRRSSTICRIEESNRPGSS